MIQTVLQNIADFLKTKAPNFLKDVYTNVTVQVTEKKGKEMKVWPGYWIEGAREAIPLLADHLTNYGYLRIVGDTTADEGPQVSSRTKMVIDRYPVRLVIHYREPAGGNTSDDLCQLFRQFLAQYSQLSDPTTGVKRVVVTGAQFNTQKEQVVDEETSGTAGLPPQDHRLFTIDFETAVYYVPGTCTIAAPQSICL